MTKIQNFINGSKSSISNEFIPVHDPSTGEQISEVVMSSEEDFKLAMKHSKKRWAQTMTL